MVGIGILNVICVVILNMCVIIRDQFEYLQERVIGYLDLVWLEFVFFYGLWVLFRELKDF